MGGASRADRYRLLLVGESCVEGVGARVGILGWISVAVRLAVNEVSS